MTFNSLVFLVFLAIVLLAYYRLQRRGQNILLLVGSYVFYGWWNWRFVALLLFTTLFDYWCARWIEREPRSSKRRLLLSFSMIVNLGILGLFKYYDFFAVSLEHVLAFFGMNATFPILHVILPVGISFYTFLSMSYTIDVFRSELQAARNPLDFMLYVSFFPHLVAGPIIRASSLLPQCQRPRVINSAEVLNGIWLIMMGYLKKVVIADRLAGIAGWGFGQATAPFSDANAWLVIYAFAFQIYGDFSGYTDIARGLAKLMGFEFVLNFKAPYMVTNPTDFWRNWHISLSTWLRDYLYIPLGGNRRGTGRTYANVMITMLLGGLWHGAGIAFLAWGLYHGALLAIHRAGQSLAGWGTRQRSLPKEGTGQTPGQNGHGAKHVLLALLFFHITCIGWLLFRAGALPPGVDQVQMILSYLRAMFHWPLAAGMSPLVQPIIMLGGLALFFQWRHKEMECFSAWRPRWQAVATALALAAITSLGVFDGTQFIYFQF